jgi:ubiquitin carboxyl-terminal hydrolase 7
MQLGDHPCSTSALTRSFGWDTEDAYVQHDCQEFCRVLMDNLSAKLENTHLAARIPGLFRGSSARIVRCLHVDCLTSRVEHFYDLTIIVKDVGTLAESFDKLVEKSLLTGDNQYDAGGLGRQDAEMWLEFQDFPSVLYLYLPRMEWDVQRQRMVKLTSRFEFPAEIDLGRFVRNSEKSQVFDLFGVLVHSGGACGGHYYAFLRPSASPDWFEFNDSWVGKTTFERAVTDNFGSASKAYGAYMLVYVRREDIASVFNPADESMIPQHLKNFVETTDDNDRAIHQDAQTSVEVMIIGEESITANARQSRLGFCNDSHKLSFPVPQEDATVVNLYRTCADMYGIPLEEVRLWKVTTGMSPFAVYEDSTRSRARETLFFQRKPASEKLHIDPSDANYFLRFFHPDLPVPIQYVGSVLAKSSLPYSAVFPVVSERLEFPPDTQFQIFEETDGFVTKLDAAEAPGASGFAAKRVVLQLPPGTPLPPTAHQWSAPDVDDRHFRFFDGSGIEPFNQTVTADVYGYSDCSKPLCRVTFVGFCELEPFRTFLAGALKWQFDPATDSLLVYKNDVDGPARSTIQTYKHYRGLE